MSWERLGQSLNGAERELFGLNDFPISNGKSLSVGAPGAYHNSGPLWVYRLSAENRIWSKIWKQIGSWQCNQWWQGERPVFGWSVAFWLTARWLKLVLAKAMKTTLTRATQKCTVLRNEEEYCGCPMETIKKNVPIAGRTTRRWSVLPQGTQQMATYVLFSIAFILLGTYFEVHNLCSHRAQIYSAWLSFSFSLCPFLRRNCQYVECRFQIQFTYFWIWIWGARVPKAAYLSWSSLVIPMFRYFEGILPCCGTLLAMSFSQQQQNAPNEALPSYLKGIFEGILDTPVVHFQFSRLNG